MERKFHPVLACRSLPPNDAKSGDGKFCLMIFFLMIWAVCPCSLCSFKDFSEPSSRRVKALVKSHSCLQIQSKFKSGICLMLKDGMWEIWSPHGLTLLWNPNSPNSSVGAAQTQLQRFPSPHLEKPWDYWWHFRFCLEIVLESKNY